MEYSKVHFDNANKFDKLNKSKILDKVYILGGNNRKLSARPIAYDG